MALAFFGLFGFIFLITQYFQFVRGYDPLSSGVHTLPFAVGAGVTAPIAARLALRWGTTRVVSTGLFSMSIGFFIMSRVSADTAFEAVVRGCADPARPDGWIDDVPAVTNHHTSSTVATREIPTPASRPSDRST